MKDNIVDMVHQGLRRDVEVEPTARIEVRAIKTSEDTTGYVYPAEATPAS